MTQDPREYIFLYQQWEVKAKMAVIASVQASDSHY